MAMPRPDRAGASRRRQVAPARIEATVAAVAREHHLRPEDIRSKLQHSEIVEARWEVWSRLAEPGISIASIARAWPCDHTTILNGLARHERGEIAFAGCRLREAA